MDIMDTGTVQISGYDSGNLTKAEEFVKSLVSGAGNGKPGAGPGGGRGRPADYAGPDPVVGQIYEGKITGIHNFGVFVEILPPPEDGSTRGFEGLCHVSELANDHVRNCEGFVKSLGVETLKVKYLGKERGKAKLSRKAALVDGSGQKSNPPQRPPLADKTNANGVDATSKPKMSEAEIDVITKAIEEL